ncbi:MAG: glycosyltransferase family 2 protein [Gammaproteobacteria bacterium]|nr:glycosyltransferase family 2 protein [Gammaproteobacteria bacterium]MBU1481686.1 glycosyltransferase family 2 protein [Gammaproteobacteria bacterium]
MYSLTIILITKNEAANIRECLQSVAWADEIIVVDSGSTDNTVAIARQMGAQVYEYDWPGFGPQKNRALDHASKDWVFSIDADERVTPELRAEIQAAMSEGRKDAYEIPRLSSFCGSYIHHSGWRPDYVTRLFRRGAGRFSDDLVHERVIVTGTTGKLQQSILHESFRDAEELLAKINQYSTAGARMLHNRNRTSSLTNAVTHALWAFVRTYFLRAGFLDGRKGFMLAVSTAEGTYYRYVKLMLLTEKK